MKFPRTRPVASTILALAVATTTTAANDPTPACPLTKCIDLLNSCGQMYGGCYPACPGYTTPTYTDPGCPATLTSPDTMITTTTTTACAKTICVDYINDCGLRYGACFPACSGYTTPSFTPPPCPVPVETNTATVTATAMSTRLSDGFEWAKEEIVEAADSRG